MTKLKLVTILMFTLALPVASQAQVRKCVNAAGKAIFTDQACTAKPGEQVSEVKDDEALRKVSKLKQSNSLEKTCWVLSHRNSQCYPGVDNTLHTVFKENCVAPIKQFEIEQKNIERRLEKEREMRHLERREEPDVDDLEYAHRDSHKSRAVLQCDALQSDMWLFLKDRFATKISAQDKKAIDYRLHISREDEQGYNTRNHSHY